MTDTNRQLSLDSLTNTNLRIEPWGALPTEVFAEIAAQLARDGVVTSTHARKALRDAWLILSDHEKEHPSEHAHLALLLLRAAEVLMDQARQGKRASRTGKLKHGVKDFLTNAGETFVDDNLSSHVRNLVQSINMATVVAWDRVRQSLLERRDSLLSEVPTGEALLSNAADDLREGLEQNIEALRQGARRYEALVDELRGDAKFSSQISANIVHFVWENLAWLLQKKAKEVGLVLVLPDVETLSKKFLSHFEKKPSAKWNDMGEELLFAAIRLAGAGPKEAKRLVREPLKTEPKKRKP
jgi:hypothetical protein